jgi:hypothetical protein
MTIRKLELYHLLQDENNQLDRFIENQQEMISIEKQNDFYNSSYLTTIEHFNLVLWFFYFFILFAFETILYFSNNVAFYKNIHFFIGLLFFPFINSLLNILYRMYSRNGFYTFVYKQYTIPFFDITFYVPFVVD